MISRFFVQSGTAKFQRARFASSLITQFDAAVASLPMREAVRYKEGNVKCSAAELKKWTEAHANALLEMGIRAGDTIIVWFPESAEKHIQMLAAAKIGATVAEFDSDVKTVPEIRAALAAAKARVISFDVNKNEPEKDKIMLLRKAIPEFYSYDDTYGQHFHSKFFPELQYFVHSGFDGEQGALQYKTLFAEDAPGNPVSAHADKTDDHTPLYVKIGSGGNTSAVMTHKQVLDGAAWPFLNNIIKKEYFEC